MSMGLIHSRSTVGSSNIHFQFTPKYRREVFENEKVREVYEQAFREIAQKLGLIFHAHEFGPEHDHLFVGNTMKYTVPYLVQRFKGYSSWKIRRECWDEIKDKLWGDSFWYDGYFHEFIGRFTDESMRYYVERQQENQWNNEEKWCKEHHNFQQQPKWKEEETLHKLKHRHIILPPKRLTNRQCLVYASICCPTVYRCVPVDLMPDIAHPLKTRIIAESKIKTDKVDRGITESELESLNVYLGDSWWMFPMCHISPEQSSIRLLYFFIFRPLYKV